VEKLEFIEEADRCRSQALAYLGTPEASLLLKVANEFERLGIERETWRTKELRRSRST
jgi:hypothetical protein